MKPNIKSLNKFFTPLLLLVIFLLRLPPIYFFPLIRSSFLTTHSLARILILLLFTLALIKRLTHHTQLLPSKYQAIFLVFTIYLISQSLSLLKAIQVISFFSIYKNILFPGFLLFLILVAKPIEQKILKIFLITLSINFFYQLVMFLQPTFYQKIGAIFIYQPHLELAAINIQRGRLYLETYDEILVPFLFTSTLFKSKKVSTILSLFFFLLIAVPSLLSNFRTRVLMLFFASFVSFIFLPPKKFLHRIWFPIMLFLIGIAVFLILPKIVGFSYVERFTLQSELEDVITVRNRIKNFFYAGEIAMANPLFGVGLGNYYDYLAGRKNVSTSLFSWKNREARIAAGHPHNIFAQLMAETGLVGLFAYLFALAYFSIFDLRVLFSSKRYSYKTFVIAFWTLFIYALFNPTTTLAYNSMFWLLRGVIHK